MFGLLFINLLLVSVWAGETSTQCPWMKEMNSRSNPKKLLAAKSNNFKSSNYKTSKQ